MPDDKAYHMTPAEFRLRGHAAIDWVADYYERVESLPVLSRVQPGDLRAALPDRPPERGEPFEAVLKDLGELILPGITHWQSPNFFAYFPANASGPAILGDLISSGLGVQGMLWSTSPACTELETHVLDWMAEMLDLPARFRSTGSGGGVIQDSASSAALCALIAARERATALASNERGCDGRLTAYASSQAHSSIEKGVKVRIRGKQADCEKTAQRILKGSPTEASEQGAKYMIEGNLHPSFLRKGANQQGPDANGVYTREDGSDRTITAFCENLTAVQAACLKGCKEDAMFTIVVNDRSAGQFVISSGRRRAV